MLISFIISMNKLLIKIDIDILQLNLLKYIKRKSVETNYNQKALHK